MDNIMVFMALALIVLQTIGFIPMVNRYHIQLMGYMSKRINFKPRRLKKEGTPR